MFVKYEDLRLGDVFLHSIYGNLYVYKVLKVLPKSVKVSNFMEKKGIFNQYTNETYEYTQEAPQPDISLHNSEKRISTTYIKESITYVINRER